MRTNPTLLHGMGKKGEREQRIDIHHHEKRLGEELRRLENDKAVSDIDRKLISKYKIFLEARGLSNGRLAKAVYQLRIMRRNLKCGFEEAQKSDIEGLIIWLNKTAYAPWSKADAKGWLKRFYRWLKFNTYEGEFPQEVAWIKTRLKMNELIEPEILTTKEVEQMLAKSSIPRDRALIAVLFESGFRIGEALNIRISDITFDSMGARVRVNGKTGPRTVRLITSAPLLSHWIDSHPEKQNGYTWLWCSLAHGYVGGQLEYHSVSSMLKSAGKKAGIQKRVYPHLFRHSAATRDAHFLNEAELRVKYGWERSSSTPSLYIHLAASDVEQKLIAIYGNGGEIARPIPEFTVIFCPRCKEKNTPGVRFCGRCGLPLDEKEIAIASMEFQGMRSEIEELKSLFQNSIPKTHQSSATNVLKAEGSSQPSSGEG